MSSINGSIDGVDMGQSRCLHARCAHPDYEYEHKRGPRKQDWGEDLPPEGAGWEKNLSWGDQGWERFDHYEEVCWRRKLDEGAGDSVLREATFGNCGRVDFFMEMRAPGMEEWIRCGQLADETVRVLFIELDAKVEADEINGVQMEYRVVRVEEKPIYSKLSGSSGA